MEKTTLIPAIAIAAAPELAADAARQPDVRSLNDWELVLVGGGETTPDW